MARAPKGKQIFETPEAYAKHVRAMEAERGPFRDHVRQLNEEFATHLATALSEQTAT